MLLHRFIVDYFRVSPDLRHILTYDWSKQTLTHHILGLRQEPTKYFRIDLDPSQLSKKDKERFDSYLAKGRPFWGRVYEPLKNPLNGNVLGPDRQSFKGLVRVQEWQKSFIMVSNAAEIIPMRNGLIVGDIECEWETFGDSFAFGKSVWYPLLRDEIGPIQRAFHDLKSGGALLPMDKSLTLDEVRKSCDIWELYLAENNLVTLTAADKTIEFPPGETPESFADRLFAQYRVLPQPKNLVLIVFSYGNARLGNRLATEKGLPLAIGRMRTDVDGRIRFGQVSLGYVPQNGEQSPSRTDDGAARSRDSIPKSEESPQGGPTPLPGSLDDVLPRPGAGKLPQVEKPESQVPVDRPTDALQEKAKLQSQLSETQQKLSATETDLNQLKQKVDAAQQEIASLKKSDKAGVVQAGSQQNVMKPQRRVFGITAKKCAEGIHIESVTPGGPATRCTDVGSGERLRMEPGDHIVSVNGIEPKTRFIRLMRAES